MGSASSQSRPPSVAAGTKNIGAGQSGKNGDPKNSKENQNRQKQQTKQATVTAVTACDIMISYSHNDKEAMNLIKDAFEEAGLKVWVDVIGLQAGVDFLSKIGQAIIDSKLFVALLSESQVKSKYCQDELALAYVSNKLIYPVALQQADVLFPMMDTGMRLQLARFHWTMIDEERREASLKQLIPKLIEKAQDVEKDMADGNAQQKKKQLTKRQSSRTLHNRQTKNDLLLEERLCLVTENLDERTKKSFWDRHFYQKDQVAWKSFLEMFYGDYKSSLEKVFSAEDREWVVGILHRELSVEDEMITRQNYIDFCMVDEEVFSFWERVQDQAVESYTMREVFNMESSVRVEAIENLGKFRSAGVVEALIDLLSDADYNVRAVAAISLARTGSDAPRVINALQKCLNEKDRLVRESACLALGHLKAESVVMKLVQLWRNDYISSVREAAQVALELIGGEEAKKAMHITSVLSEEIRLLTKD